MKIIFIAFTCILNYVFSLEMNKIKFEGDICWYTVKGRESIEEKCNKGLTCRFEKKINSNYKVKKCLKGLLQKNEICLSSPVVARRPEKCDNGLECKQKKGGFGPYFCL